MNLKEYSKTITKLISFDKYMIELIENHKKDYYYYKDEIDDEDYNEEDLKAIYLSNFTKTDQELLRIYIKMNILFELDDREDKRFFRTIDDINDDIKFFRNNFNRYSIRDYMRPAKYSYKKLWKRELAGIINAELDKFMERNKKTIE